MTLDDLRALCEREWRMPDYGDVIALKLTGEGFSELLLALFQQAADWWGPQVRFAVPMVPTALNPVTGSTVKLSIGAPPAITTVRCADLAGGTTTREVPA